MTAFIFWYILITLLGWLVFPLAYYLFPALADRGYTISRAFGLLAWGYVFWLFASLGIAQNDIGGLLLGLLVVAGLSAWAYFTPSPSSTTQLIAWLKEKKFLIITTEILFLVAFGFMAFARASNPEITTAGGEKWMEVAFINAILHSPTFPPHDPWLSGYAISYYYFGYVMTAMLAKFTSTPASIAHNLMLSLIFGLSAIGAYGILYNLLVIRRKSNVENPSSSDPPLSSFFLPLLAPLFLLVISNLEGFLESLHRRGIGWIFNSDGSAISWFWKWMNLKELTNPPNQPLTWVPDQFFWWWRASRVIQDFDLNGQYREVIDEFPFFSYLLGDLHPHVLAMPFLLLAIAIALNLYLGAWHGTIDLFFGQLKINKTGFFTIALVLGGLAFLNTWDILIAAALIVFGYGLARVHETGWGWERIEDVLLLGIPAVVIAYALYLPFFMSFDSQAGGIIPNFMYPTRGTYLWVMWGTLFVPLFAYLIYLWRSKTPANWRAGIFTMLGILVALLAAMFLIGFIALKLKPDMVMPILQSQGLDVRAFIAGSMVRRLTYIGGLLTLLAILIPALAFLFKCENSLSFILLMITLGALLILGPDFLYLRDNFGYRINTVFKFYFEAWILFSLAAAFAVAVMLSELRGLTATLYTIIIIVIIGVGLTYPVLSLPNKTDNFKVDHPEQRTLDGSAYLTGVMPDDYQAIQFMKQLEPGVVAEAVGGQYSEYARIATYTGLPTVLGWPGHEDQWRDHALQGSREHDIQVLYTTPDWITAQDIIHRYNIRYVVVGNLERTAYRVNEEKFNRFLKPIFQQSSITIYEVP
jgi:YYY domain-containing protein